MLEVGWEAQGLMEILRFELEGEPAECFWAGRGCPLPPAAYATRFPRGPGVCGRAEPPKREVCASPSQVVRGGWRGAIVGPLALGPMTDVLWGFWGHGPGSKYGSSMEGEKL